ncbi:MAG: hypothetical protein A2493_00395 [Candidatus Magasanikbacteria bacterium RIFOXYC12_FULL_33_11]|uniref:DUF4145 domain-containing protein n=1 Tax=Candidatus Magasanikbacteria bacterium RIFOXYC12_FULL_33_11 TaxID=1798701 RepID=A0A1F6NM25_9BACT|nr:MAG: hypothetical protein A2493_00395 [Candidatus Magasanikbacteria bacterium RIFOXYC12_FULL_33_11]
MEIKKPKEILDILNKQSELLIFVLRSHLIIEYFLEKIINQKTSIKLKGKETFYTKILVIEAINLIPEEIIKAIKELNTLRNKIGHELDYEIKEKDTLRLIEYVNRFSTYKEINTSKNLQKILIYLMGFLNGYLYKIQNN